MRLLIVDDDLTAAEPLARALAARGHDAEVCGGAEAALARLREAPRDAVILYARAAPDGGLALLAALRASAGPPALLLTEPGAAGLAARARALRAEVLPRSIGPARIVERLEAIGADAGPPPEAAPPLYSAMALTADALGETLSPSPLLADIERGVIERAGEESGWDPTEMCRRLGVDREALRRKLKAYALPDLT